MYYFQEEAVLPRFSALTPASILLDQIAVLISIAVALYLALRSLGNTLERARSGERAQIKANSELTALRASLEERVAELERAEKSLRDSEASYHALVENLPQSIFVKDLEGRFVFANQRLCDGFGKPRKEIVGKTDFDFYPPELAEKYRADDRRVMEQGKTLDIVEENQLLGGEKSYVHVVKTPTFDSSGRVTGIQGIYWDVTERERAEEILRQSHLELEKLVEARTAELARERNLLRTLIEVLPDYIYIKDAESRFIITNIANARALGVESVEQTLGKTDLDFYPKHEAAQYYADEQALVRSGQPLLNKEEVAVDKTGKKRWTLTIKVPIRDSNGQVIGIAGVGRDITERKQMEDVLRESEERFRSILDNIQDGYFEVDTAGNFTFFNPALVRMLGRPSNELMGMNNRLYMTPEGGKAVFQIFNRIFRTGIPEQALDWGLVRPDGTLRSVEVSVSLIKAADGSIHGFRGTARDITKRKQMEEALRESEERFRKLFEASPDAVMLIDAGDPRWLIVDCNPAACQMNGYTREELIGQSVDLLNASATDPAERARFLDRLRREGMLQFETRRRHKNGTIFPIEVSTTLITVWNKELVLWIDRDITERKQAEETLRRLSTHDSLTGLYNRAFFEGELKRLEASRLFPVSIIMTDVDDLKTTNDCEGHAAGDELLRRTAAVLGAAFRAEDIIARIGGDEFAVLLPQTTAEVVRHAVDRCRMEINRQNDIPGKPRLSLSIGAATAAASENLTQTLQLADENMYQDKAARKDPSGER